MNRTLRVTVILDEVPKHGSVRVAELAERFGVSPITIRRDLDLLATQGLVERTHGGARSVAGAVEVPARYKEIRHAAQKQSIAAHVAASICEGEVIGLTGGTTTMAVARAVALLPGTLRLTVVTNALDIATELAARAPVKVVVTGGVCRAASSELVGPLAEASIAGLRPDVCFIGADGCSGAGGLTTHDEVEAATNRALAAAAARAVAVVDHSKLGRTAFARICGVTEVDEIVTDAAAPEPLVEELRAAGARRVELAPIA